MKLTQVQCLMCLAPKRNRCMGMNSVLILVDHGNTIIINQSIKKISPPGWWLTSVTTSMACGWVAIYCGCPVDSKHIWPSWPEQSTLLLNHCLKNWKKQTSLVFVIDSLCPCWMLQHCIHFTVIVSAACSQYTCVSAWCYDQCQVASFTMRRFKFPNTYWTVADTSPKLTNK